MHVFAMTLRSWSIIDNALFGLSSCYARADFITFFFFDSASACGLAASRRPKRRHGAHVATPCRREQAGDAVAGARLSAWLMMPARLYARAGCGRHGRLRHRLASLAGYRCAHRPTAHIIYMHICLLTRFSSFYDWPRPAAREGYRVSRASRRAP